MREMRQYVCWTDRAVRAATPRDAAALGPGHFHAVHHPLKLRQRPLGTRRRGMWVEETEIVRVLEGPLRPDGYLLVPIVGGSGTGKSHLVRWVWNRTKDHDNWETRYLAKNRTSIRRAIEIVIEGLEGPAISAAREALHRAPAQSESDRVLAERLLDELALLTKEEPATEVEATDPTAAQMAAKLRRELPDILRDPVVRRRLTADDAVIPRLVGLARRGRSYGDGLDDDAIRIVEDDLPLAFAQIGEASKGARRLLTQLAGISHLRSAAVGMINVALPVAVKRVFLSGQVDLVEVFRDVRRELLSSGKDLVLFIEDLTVLHGVEREFLDAIIEPARSPDGDLCALRVLFAVTDGHFVGLDTVRTRCDDAYGLNAGYGPDGVGHDEAISFLGRYLNACRQDPQEVESRWANRQNNALLLNACDTCDHQVHCHETFGRSDEGYGLYPFNSAAVNRFVESLSSERFDPREIVRELVNRFLIVAATDLQRGDFPSDALVGHFNDLSEPLDPLIQAQLKSKRPVDFARVVNSMRYWSESSTVVGDAILAAFGLDVLEELDRAPTQRSRANVDSSSVGASRDSRRSQRPTSETTLASRLSSPWSGIFVELNTWAGNRRDLSAKATNNLKKLVHRSILQNLDFSALPINLGTSFDHQKRFDRLRHVHIGGSVTDQRQGDPIVEIKREADTAAALQGLILLRELPDADDYPRADNYRRQAARYLEEWTLHATTGLEQSPEPVAAQAVTGLLVCAVVAGACEGASGPHEYLAALFGTSPSPMGPERSPKWKTAVEEADITYRRLRPVVEAHFGEARGTGATRAIRADQMLAVIQDFVDSRRLESRNVVTDRFMRSVTAAVKVEWETLETLVTDAAPRVDPKRSWSQQAERVLEVLDAAQLSGRLRDHDAPRYLRKLNSSLDENAHRPLLSTAKLLCHDLPIIERLQVVASGLPDLVATTSEFVSRADLAMSGIATDIDERQASEPAGETLEDVTSDVVDAFNLLAEIVKEFEK